MAITTSTDTLLALSTEASALLEKAKKYREEMDALPPGDSRRAVYERLIRDLLSASRTISANVTVSASST